MLADLQSQFVKTRGCNGRGQPQTINQEVTAEALGVKNGRKEQNLTQQTGLNRTGDICI